MNHRNFFAELSGETFTRSRSPTRRRVVLDSGGVDFLPRFRYTALGDKIFIIFLFSVSRCARPLMGIRNYFPRESSLSRRLRLTSQSGDELGARS